MDTRFRRRTGPSVHISELEYISALHQTDDNLRQDCTIGLEDVAIFLMSRHGVEVTEDDVRETIMRDFGTEDGDFSSLDLAQLLALLCIPYFLKCAAIGTPEQRRQLAPLLRGLSVVYYHRESRRALADEERQNRVADVLRPDPAVMDEVYRRLVTSANIMDDNDDRVPPLFTTDLIRKILRSVGQDQLANNDEIVNLMKADIAPASDGEDVVFDKEMLLRALTLDVQGFDDAWREAEFITHYDDAMQAGLPNTVSSWTAQPPKRRQIAPMSSIDSVPAKAKDISDEDEEAVVSHQDGTRSRPQNQEQSPGPSTSATLSQASFTASCIDFTAGNFRSTTFAILLWLTTVATYFAYLYELDNAETLDLGCSSSFEDAEDPSDGGGLGPEEEGFACPALELLRIDTGENMTDIFLVGALFRDDNTNFGCSILESVLVWLLLIIQLSVFAAIFLFLGSMGNSAVPTRSTVILIGMAAIALVSIPFFASDVNAPFFNTVKRDNLPFQMLYVFNLSFACILLFMQGRLLYGNYLKRKQEANATASVSTPAPSAHVSTRMMASLLSVFTSPSGRSIAESKVKQAAAFKLNGMLGDSVEAMRALQDSSPGSTTQNNDQPTSKRNEDPPPARKVQIVEFKRAMHSMNRHDWSDYFARSQQDSDDAKKEGLQENAPIGGIVWTSGRIRTGKLFSEDGVSINCFVIAGNIAQFFVSLFFLAGTVALWNGVSGVRNYFKGLQEQMGIAESTATELSDAENFLGLVQRSLEKLLITMGVGSFFGFIAAIVVAANFQAAAVSTKLRFREGLLPSLRDTDDRGFPAVRRAVDDAFTLVGASVWGAVFSALSVTVLIGTFLFFLTWEGTQYVTQVFVANQLGTLVAIFVVKLSLLVFFSRRHYAGLYRKRPGQQNVLAMLIATWNISLSFGRVFARMIGLILMAAAYSGRFDTPFLHGNLGTFFGGAYRLDSMPLIFRKALLLDEAHSHPYLERLGVLYLLKLRHRKSFGRRSGSLWRLVFVLALMPWMGPYRCIEKRSVTDEEYGDDDEEAGS